MRYLFSLFLLCLAAVNAKAQYAFNVRDPLHAFSSINTSVVPMNGMYYCASISWDSSEYIPDSGYVKNVWGVNLAIYDSLGRRTRDTIYLQSPSSIYPWSNNLYPTDTGFLLGAEIIDTSGAYQMIIMSFDKQGHNLWYKEYPQTFCTEDKFYRMIDFKPTGTGQWLMLSTVWCSPGGLPTQNSIVLTKLDSNFNVIWSQRYGFSGHGYFYNLLPGRLLVEQDGYLIAGSSSNLGIVRSGFIVQANIMKTDTSGNQKWNWLSDTSEKINTIEDIIRTKDGGYVYCGEGDGYEEPTLSGLSDIFFHGWIEKLDSNRNVLWSHALSPFAGSDALDQKILKELPNGDIILAGMVADGFDSSHLIPDIDTTTNVASLIKFDPDGNIIWARYYNIKSDSFKYEYTIHDMKQTPDGGYILAGEADGFGYPLEYPTQQSWLVKVDSNGCSGADDPQCNPTAIPKVLEQPSVQVYPNPAADILQIKYSQLENGQIAITDIEGRTLTYSTLTTGVNKIDVKNLLPGVYLYKIIIRGSVTNGRFVKL